MEKTKKDKAKKIAFVTYNRIGNGKYENGVIKKPGVNLYIAQNGHKAKWAADSEDADNRMRTRYNVAASVAKQLDLSRMDHTYLYVGSDGGEEAIRQTKDLPSDKISYVMCYCNYDTKTSMIKRCGNSKSEVIMCECGGRETLESILKKYVRADKR